MGFLKQYESKDDDMHCLKKDKDKKKSKHFEIDLEESDDEDQPPLDDDLDGEDDYVAGGKTVMEEDIAMQLAMAMQFEDEDNLKQYTSNNQSNDLDKQAAYDTVPKLKGAGGRL